MDGPLAVLIRAVGAVIGAGLALVFLPPKNRAEFVTRGAFSIIVGIIGAYPVRVYYLHWEETWELRMAAAVLVAMLSWFVMGAVVRIIGMWKPKE